MRDLRFRAWHGKSLGMFYYDMWKSYKDDVFTLCCGSINDHIMQYTGLKDKNGKEIYEGDIMKWDAQEWGSEYSEEVTWDYELLDARKNDWGQWCEVVGNIYQHPELLGE